MGTARWVGAVAIAACGACSGAIGDDGVGARAAGGAAPTTSGTTATGEGGATGTTTGEGGATGTTTGEGGATGTSTSTTGAGGTGGTTTTGAGGEGGGPPPTCPDGTCGAGEDCAICPADCGACCAQAPLACGKIGAQTLQPTAEWSTFLGRCPRVAKWVSGGGTADYAGMAARKCACKGATTVLRVWGPPASYATAADLWAARYAFLDAATPEQRASIDLLESDNECDAGHCFSSLADAQAYGAFLADFVAIAKAKGFRPLVGNIAVGNPGGDVDACAGDGMKKFGALVPAIEAAGAAGGGFGYHAYTNAWTASATEGLMPYLPFRYRKYLACFPSIAAVPLVLTEAGFDKGGNPDQDGWAANGSKQDYLAWLAFFQAEIAKDASVLGATLFTFAPAGNWSSFRLEAIAKELGDVATTCP